MKIFLASDHAGYELKESIKSFLNNRLTLSFTRKSEIFATEGKSEISATEMKSEISATEMKSEISATEMKSEISATEMKSEISATEGKSEISATEMKSEISATEGKSEISATEGKSEISATEGKSEISATERKSIEPIRTEVGETIEFHDFGAYTSEPIDYVDTGISAAEALKTNLGSGNRVFGILICGTGQGMSMIANKVNGIRASLCLTPEFARLARQHNDANVLVLAGRFLNTEQALEILTTFLNEPFSDEIRHKNRIEKINKYEMLRDKEEPKKGKAPIPIFLRKYFK